ncbi:MAG: hypothetical protein WA217_15910, partial [Candidatus Binatus sp.]
NFVEDLPVPELKVILPRRKCHLAIESRKIAQGSWNENPPLPIDRHFLRPADEKCFERLHPRIESWLASQSRIQRVPLTRRVQRQASLSGVREIRDIETIVILALQNFAKSGRDTHPTFFVDRMLEPTAEHWFPSPTLHNIPLYPTSVKQIARAEM